MSADEDRPALSALVQVFDGPGSARVFFGALVTGSGTRCIPVVPQPSQVKRREPTQPAFASSREETCAPHAGQASGFSSL
jgi:hypothetical protein